MRCITNNLILKLHGGVNTEIKIGTNHRRIFFLKFQYRRNFYRPLDAPSVFILDIDQVFFSPETYIFKAWRLDRVR